ncbi:MAG: ATP-grasp domain-containing protein [Epsilonproteobacteria bacterium]|nr:ATP-grasp domain-containing protein [Campylobacterota bacterium]
MGKSVRVLVSGVGGDVGQGVIKALQKSNLDLEIYKICVFEDSSFLHLDDKSFIAPFSADESYIDYLITLMNKLKIDIFFPTVDSEIVKISKNKDILEECTNAKVFVGDIDKVLICDDKYLTYEFLTKHGFATPRTIIPNSFVEVQNFVNEVGTPFVVKKRWDNGAKNFHILKDIEESKIFIGDDDFIFQEYLDDKEGEFTCGVYLGEDKRIKGVCILKRELKCGSTYKARRVRDKELEEQVENVAKSLGLKYLNIQARKIGGKFYIFEFNGRLSGTTATVSRVFNAPEMAIRELVLNERVERSESDEMFVMMRYHEEIYTDLEKIENLHKRSDEINKLLQESKVCH